MTARIRRLSMMNPALLTTSEQTALVEAADQNPQLQRLVAAQLGITWGDLTFGQKLSAVNSHIENGRSLAVINRATEVFLQAERLSSDALEVRRELGENNEPE